MHFNLITTLALAGVVLLVGEWLRRVLPPLSRYNVPGPVIGGLVVAMAALALRHWRLAEPTFDDALREPLQNAFFSTIGFGASYTLLRRGGGLVAALLALTLIGGVLQNLVGAGLATALGQSPLFGVLCGSVTLTGGPATGLAFAPDFVEAGVPGAAAISLAAAMSGIVAAGVLGAPLGTLLVHRQRVAQVLEPGPPQAAGGPTGKASLDDAAQVQRTWATRELVDVYALIKGVAFIVLAVALGAVVSQWLTDHRVKLPSYIGAMLVAVAVRNIDDATGWLGAPQRAIELLGGVALAFFLALALMSLDLSVLSAVALPLVVILLAQIVLMAALCAWPVYALLGRDYDAAVTTAGFYGFMIGTTPVAVASMESLVERYGPSPRAFLAVPIVGAFLLDFVNAILIQWSLNISS